MQMIYLRLKRKRRTRRLFDSAMLPVTDPAALPRRIYLFWDKGFDAAPEPCPTCLDSWRRLNPGWEVITLDATAADAVISRDCYPPEIKPAHYSDLLRAHLLDETGGVWVDATLLCLKPLDCWLPQIFAQTDFFAFARPGADRMLSSWFLAAAPGAPALKMWLAQSERLWTTHPGSEKPYFWFHYTFEYLCRLSPPMRRAWAAVPQISAEPLCRLQRCLATGTFSEADWATIRASPVQKLTYKHPKVPAGLADALRELERWRPTDATQ